MSCSHTSWLGQYHSAWVQGRASLQCLCLLQLTSRLPVDCGIKCRLQGLRQNMVTALLQQGDVQPQMRIDVLNGIAWDAEGRRLFVTGKLWPRLYQVCEAS